MEIVDANGNPSRRIEYNHSTPLGEAARPALLDEIADKQYSLFPSGPDQWGRAIYLGRLINVEYEQGLWEPYIGDTALAGYFGENNIVTFASAGGGKNACAIIPTLLCTSESCFVNDMKGENWFVTHWFRERVLGHKIVCINPFNLYGRELGYENPMTHHYNPLEKLRPVSPNFVADINTLAAALIITEGKEPHWSSRARDLVGGIMALLCECAAKPDMAAHIRGCLGMPEGAPVNTLPVMRELLGLDEKTFELFCQWGTEQSAAPVVRANLGTFSKMTKESSSIVSTAIGQLAFLLEPALVEFLSHSDFDFADLRTQPTTIYCMIPSALMNTYFRFVRVLVQSCFNTLALSSVSQRPSVLMLLDEQAKLKGLECVKEAVATVRGAKVRVWSVYQDLNQLKADYPQAWETFIANAGIVQVMTVNDSETAKYFSDKVGDTYTKVPSSSENTDPSGVVRLSNGETWQKMPYMNPQWFYGMSQHYQLVFAQRLRYPILVQRQPYFAATDEAWLHPLNLQGEAWQNPEYPESLPTHGDVARYLELRRDQIIAEDHARGVEPGIFRP